MLAYSLLAAIYMIFSYSKISKYSKGLTRKQFIFLMLLPAFILVAFRDISIGNDTYIYYYGFNNIAYESNLLAAIANSRYEPGYVVLNYIASHLNGSYYFFQFLVSAFIFLLIAKFLFDKSDNIAFSCFVFLTTRMLLGTMNTVRMWIAIAILLHSIKSIENRRFLRFCIQVLFAALFHKTAFIFLIMYPLSILKDKRKYKVFIITAACFLALLGSSFFVKLTSILRIYEGYLNSIYFNQSGNLAVYLSLAIDVAFLLVFIIYKKDFIKDTEQLEESSTVSIKYISYMAMFVVVALDIIGLKNTIMSRVSAYFSMLYLFAIPHLIEYMEDRKSAELLRFGIIVFLLIQFYVVMVFRPEWNGVTPYKFYFNN